MSLNLRPYAKSIIAALVSAGWVGVMSISPAFSQTAAKALLSSNPAVTADIATEWEKKNVKALKKKKSVKPKSLRQCTPWEVDNFDSRLLEGVCEKKGNEETTGTENTDKPSTPPSQCQLTVATNEWKKGIKEVRVLSKNLKAIIIKSQATKTSPDRYADTTFGLKSDKTGFNYNREIATRRFIAVQDILNRVTRKIAGNAVPACHQCFVLSDWHILRTAAEFVYQSKNFDDPDERIGAGKFAKEVNAETIVPTDLSDLTSAKIDLKVNLGEMSLPLFRCLIRRINFGDLAHKKAYYIPSLAKTLCKGKRALLKGDTKERKTSIKSLQVQFNYLLSQKKSCSEEIKKFENENAAKLKNYAITSKLKMSTLDKKNCVNDSTAHDFFMPSGAYGTSDEVCAWDKTLETLAKIEAGDESISPGTIK